MWIAVLVGLGVLAWQHPSVYERGDLIGRWLQGGTPAVSLRQLGVMLAPYMWREPVRQWLQPTLPGWASDLTGYAAADGKAFTSHALLRGPAGNLEDLDLHYSILQAGARPHPPHVHVEEEVIVLVAGRVRIFRGEEGAGQRVTELERGQLAYHASREPHTIEAIGPGAARYVIFKWQGRWELDGNALESRDYDFREALAAEGAGGFSTTLLFEAQTAQVGKLHAHVSAMRPGGGYDAHRDFHDIGIVLLEGAVETLGNQVRADGVMFYPADSLHGMRNGESEMARYVVFEFHPAGGF